MTSETATKAGQKARLTGMQRQFVKHMAATGDKEYAAWKAGFADPLVAGNKLMYKAHVRDSVYAEQMRRLEDEGSVVAVDRLIKTAGDDTKPVGAQVNASKVILDHIHKAREGQAQGKELSEMTMAELQAIGREAEQNARMAHRLLEVMSGQVEDAQAVEIQPEGDVFG